MQNVLAIESSASLCSLALTVKGMTYSREQEGARSHTQFMLAFVDELLTEADITVQDLTAIAFSAGPGSFTGIRLAASTAKSLAYAAKIPVVAVSSLAVLAQGFYRQSADEKNCTVITDARMGEVYVGQYECCERLAKSRESDQLLNLEVAAVQTFDDVIVGDAQTLLEDKAAFEQAQFHVLSAHAIDVLSLALDKIKQGDVSSAMQAEAIYLRGKSGWKTTKQQLAEKAKKLSENK